MNKNIVKAVIYVVGGFAITLISCTLMVFMYFSTTFLPVYVGNTYVVGNQIVRWALYIILLAIILLSLILANYGSYFLSKKFHQRKRRH